MTPRLYCAPPCPAAAAFSNRGLALSKSWGTPLPSAYMTPSSYSARESLRAAAFSYQALAWAKSWVTPLPSAYMTPRLYSAPVCPLAAAFSHQALAWAKSCFTFLPSAYMTPSSYCARTSPFAALALILLKLWGKALVVKTMKHSKKNRMAKGYFLIIFHSSYPGAFKKLLFGSRRLQPLPKHRMTTCASGFINLMAIRYQNNQISGLCFTNQRRSI